LILFILIVGGLPFVSDKAGQVWDNTIGAAWHSVKNKFEYMQMDKEKREKIANWEKPEPDMSDPAVEAKWRLFDQIPELFYTKGTTPYEAKEVKKGLYRNRTVDRSGYYYDHEDGYRVYQSFVSSLRGDLSGVLNDPRLPIVAVFYGGQRDPICCGGLQEYEEVVWYLDVVDPDSAYARKRLGNVDTGRTNFNTLPDRYLKLKLRVRYRIVNDNLDPIQPWKIEWVKMEMVNPKLNSYRDRAGFYFWTPGVFINQRFYSDWWGEKARDVPYEELSQPMWRMQFYHGKERTIREYYARDFDPPSGWVKDGDMTR